MSILNNKQEELEAILASDAVILGIQAAWKAQGNCDSLFLTGGAVIDILEGRKPKDYDFRLEASRGVQDIVDKAVKMGLEFDYTSATAISFRYKGTKVQVLHKPLEEFPFTIEASKFSVSSLKFRQFDMVSFETKKLIPQDSAYDLSTVSRKTFKNRIKKWESKGFTIHPITRKSYLKKSTYKSFWRKFTEVFFSKTSKDS